MSLKLLRVPLIKFGVRRTPNKSVRTPQNNNPEMNFTLKGNEEVVNDITTEL